MAGKKVSSSIRAKYLRWLRVGWLYIIPTRSTYRPAMSRDMSDARTVALMPAEVKRSYAWSSSVCDVL